MIISIIVILWIVIGLFVAKLFHTVIEELTSFGEIIFYTLIWPIVLLFSGIFIICREDEKTKNLIERYFGKGKEKVKK